MVLHSPKLFAHIKKTIAHGEKHYFHPFVWNKSRNEPELSKSKRRLFLWYLNVLVTVLYSIFLIFRAVEVHLEDGASIGKIVYMRFILFFQSFPALFQLCICLKKDEFSRFILMISQFLEQVDAHNWMSDLESGSKPKPKPKRGQKGKAQGEPKREFQIPKIFEVFYDFVWYGFALACFGVGQMSALKPHAADKISSVLLHENDKDNEHQKEGILLVLSIFIRVSCVLFQVYYNVMYCEMASLWIFTAFSLMFPAVVILGEIKNELKPSGSGSLTKTKVTRILHTYKSMEVLMKHFHQIYCTLLIPTSKLIMMSLTVLCTYGAIKMSGFLAVFLAIIGVISIIILVAILGAMAGIHTYSAEIVFLMKGPQFQKHLNITEQKYVRALTIVKLKIGFAYYVDKECVITALQTIVDSTVDLLIANS